MGVWVFFFLIFILRKAVKSMSDRRVHTSGFHACQPAMSIMESDSYKRCL